MRSRVSRNSWIVVTTMIATFVVLRVWLHLSPNSDLNVLGYNIHHLFTGLLFVVLGGIPLSMFDGQSRWLDLARVSFGLGLAMALDEWVFLIATDGSNSSYLLPISLWGGIIVLALACVYALALCTVRRRD